MATRRIALVTLALGLSLTGCTQLPNVASLVGAAPDGVPAGLLGNLGAQQGAAAGSLTANSLASLQTEDDLQQGEALASDTTIKTQAFFAQDATGSATASVTASAKDLRYAQHAKDRIAQKKAAVQNLSRTTQTNADGSVLQRATFDFKGKNGTQHQVIDKTFRKSDGSLIASHSHLEDTQSNGLKRVVDRDRKLNADGSWTVIFNSQVTRKDGKTLIVLWTRTEGKDGTESGKGSLTGYDGNTASTSLAQASDGTVSSKTRDDKNHVEVDVVKAEGSASASVSVIELTSGKTTGSATINDVGAVPHSDK